MAGFAGLTRVGNALLAPATKKLTPPTVNKPKPAQPNTNVATQWSLYSAYPPGPDWPYSEAVPTSQPTDKGYDVEVSRLNSARKQALMDMANGQLLDGPGGYRYLLFIQNFRLNLTLAGSYGQSQYTRDFYPRNFVQPQVVVTGQSPSQEDYGNLCEFVHSCQHKAVANGFQNLTQLFIAGRNSANGFSGRGVDGKRTSGTRVMVSEPNAIMAGRPTDPTSAPAGTYYSQTIHGAHQPFLAKGYISQMPRIHQQFQYAVQWQMTFTIAAILQGPFNDQGNAYALPNSAPNTWLTMLNDIKASGVTSSQTPGLVKKNQQIVRAASTASINPLTPNFDPTPAGSGNGNSGTPAGSASSVSPNANSIMSYLMGQGMTQVAAAGIVGNMQQESSLNPAEAGGGLCQWIGDRWTALVTYANQQGLDPNGTQAQLQYLMNDLNGSYSSLKAKLNNDTTPKQAADDFCNTYERPGTPAITNREAYAQAAYDGYTGSSATASQVSQLGQSFGIG